MSIYGALRVGVAGLNVQSQAVATASDNIANVNTTGFKSSRARFSTLVTSSSGPGTFSPGGVQTVIRNEISAQGLISNTNVATDVAIQGSGFFTVTDKLTRNVNTGRFEIGGNVFFTRAGEFRPDASGNLVNPQGYYLVGWPANPLTGEFERTNVHSALTGLNVANQTTTPIPTSDIFISANLNAQAIVSDTFDITTQLLDKQGSKRSLQLIFKKETNGTNQGAGAEGTSVVGNRWQVSARVIGESGYAGGLAIQQINNNNGTPSANIDASISSALTATNSVLAGNTNLTDFSRSTGTGFANNNPNPTDIDGSVKNAVPIALVSFAANGTLKSVEAIDGQDWSGVNGSLANDAQKHAYALNKAGSDGATLNALWRTSVPNSNTPSLNTGVTIFTSVDNNAHETVGVGAAAVSQQFQAGTIAPDDNVAVSIRFGTLGQTDGLSQFDGANSINYFTQNGREFGSLSAVTFDKDGVATAQFDNGDTRKIYQLPITTFSNPNGLLSFSGNVYGETGTSGSAIAHIANTGGAGKISASSLEASTVDLAGEFTELIIAQRNYSANTKSITTADQLLEQLVQLIR